MALTRDSGDSLLEFVSSVAGEELLKVEENLGDGFVRLRVSEAERRQAKHDIRCVEDACVELLRNSRDAGARRIFFATSKEGAIRRLVCIDDGEGVPAHLHEAVFEPRVTSKLDTMTVDTYGVHGRGMALYSLKANMVEAGVVWSQPEKGTALLAVADTSTLPERKDQSTWPEVEVTGGETAVIKGPHNIPRAVAEFALAAPHVDVYVGSPAEVVSTMRRVATAEHGVGRLFERGAGEHLPAWQRSATAVDTAELTGLSRSLYALPISERNAQRILSDEIGGLPPVAERLGARHVDAEAAPRRVDLAKDRRSVRLEQMDLDALAAAAADAFRRIAEKYYLHTDVEPRVTATSDEIRIRLSMRKLE